MAILEHEIIIDLKKGLLKHFKDMGYPVSSIKTNNGKVPKGTTLLVKVEDLPKGSTIKLTKICDECGKHIPEQQYHRILSYREKNNGSDLCRSCGTRNGAHRRIENVPFEDSLEYFAVENNKEYLLKEYSAKNENLPSQIFKGSGLTSWWNCPKCGSEYDVAVYQRTLYNLNCPYCNGKRVNHTNCLWTTHPHIAKLLTDSKLGYEVTAGSSKKMDFTCPDCGNVNSKIITHINERGFSCSKCSDGLSYPEKFMISVLSQLGLEFETQKVFAWALNKRYDFFLENLSVIIETHGGHHYNGRFSTLNGKTLLEEQKNDEIKEKLAYENGIEKFIVIDCLNSNFEYIKNSIISSKLANLFNLDNIDWLKCDIFACKSIIKDVCDLWNQGLSRKEIEKIVHLSYTTVIEYLKKGNSFGWCIYNGRNEMLKSNRETANKNSKKVIQLSLNMEFINEFKSLAEASRLTNISQTRLSNACNGRQKTAGGFIWIFKDNYEYILNSQNIVV